MLKRILKSRDITDKGLSSQSCGFSSSQVWMWELDYKEGFIVGKEIQPVHPKGNQSWVFIRGTDVEAETPILWSPDAKNCFTGKDPDAGKDWRREEKATTEDEMIGWYHQLNGHELE